jgi:sulfite reductase (NADPH) hemoprotein beta-component
MMTVEGVDPQANRRQPMKREELVRASDATQFRAAFERTQRGEMSEDAWTAFRLRFGIYGQLQPGVHMVRIKVPGGNVSPAQARAVARLNRRYAGSDVHVTTRQDYQIYSVKPEEAADLLEGLAAAGLTTREGCGNTLRNMTACPYAGVCPHENVDAGQVAAQLTRSWLRHPLAQHMPRKFKVAVSGCEADCAISSIHDLGLVAVRQGERQGFRVYAGGGLGGIPRAAIKIMDFATEDELPAVLEALLRLHQRYSNRANKNAARIKFLVKKFGEERFIELFTGEFNQARHLPQRPWEPLAWRKHDKEGQAVRPVGTFTQHDGRLCVVVNPPLGLLSSDRLEALAGIAERYAYGGLRNTADQTVALLGIDPEQLDAAVTELREHGLVVEERREEVTNVVVCPGTTSCRIGITNSQNFGREILETVRTHPIGSEVSVRVSGCQNSCGLHHVGDFGFHGMGKKINGRSAPHYQVHVGGDPHSNGAIGITGPIVPARLAKEALQLLLDGYTKARQDKESVRDWALRLGKEGLSELLVTLGPDAVAAMDDASNELFTDWGDLLPFKPPASSAGECASPFALDLVLGDLAKDGLNRFDRALAAGRTDAALAAGEAALCFTARRLVQKAGLPTDDEDSADTVSGHLRRLYTGRNEVIEAMETLHRLQIEARKGKGIDAYREALVGWAGLADALTANPVPSAAAAE